MMTRCGLSIQRKFLILFLLVGLIPAIVGVVVTVLGARFSFAWAMSKHLESRAQAIAIGLGQYAADLDGKLGRIVDELGGERDALNRIESAAGALGGIDILVYDRPGMDPLVRELSLDRSGPRVRLDGQGSLFGRIRDRLQQTHKSYFGDVIPLRVEPGGAELALIVFGYAEPGGGAYLFFTQGDHMMGLGRAGLVHEAETVHLYSRNGYLLTSSAAPPGAVAKIQTHFAHADAAASGWFDIRRRKAGHRTNHVVGYASIRALPSMAAENPAAAPWVALVSHDMENFMVTQSKLIWGAVFVALAWALALMGISILATRKVVGPMKSLRRQAEALTSGNLNARVGVRTHDEIRDLAESFNTMASQLKQSHLDLKSRAEESRLRAEHIHVINEITRAITQALDLNRTFDILKRDLKKAVDFDGLWIARVKAAGEPLRVTHASPARLLEYLESSQAPMDWPFHRRAMRDGAARSGSIGAKPGLDPIMDALRERFGYASILAAPLPSVRGALGTLTLVSCKPEAYDREDESILESVAAAVAVGIEQAELFARTRHFARELERTVARRTRELADANKKLILTEKYHALGRMAGGLAHEINNPLGIIKNYLSLMSQRLAREGRGRGKDDPSLKSLNVINDEIDRIGRIVRRLLDLHRPPEHTAERTDIGAMLSDLLTLMENDLAKHHIQVHRSIQPGMDRPLVSSDLIRQVLVNLLGNAQDAMAEGGALTVEAKQITSERDDSSRGAITVSISDTGCGIEAQNLGNIFDPFYTSKPPDKGTGLGLSVSYGIMQMYRGSIDVRSEPGKGSTFTVTLPVDPGLESPWSISTSRSGDG